MFYPQNIEAPLRCYIYCENTRKKTSAIRSDSVSKQQMHFKYVQTLTHHKKKAVNSGEITNSLRAFHNIQLVQFIVTAASKKYNYLFYLKTFLRLILNTCFNIIFNPAINSKNGLPNCSPKYSTESNINIP